MSKLRFLIVDKKYKTNFTIENIKQEFLMLKI